jgi:hypothetical protein
VSGPVIGSVAVEVVPDARGWVSKFRALVLPGAGRVGDEYGALFGDEASKKAVAAFDRGMARSNPKLAGARQGDAFGDAFSGSVRKALENLPKAKLDGDATDIERKLDGIRAQLGGLDTSFGLHLTDETALRALQGLRLELDQLTGPEHDVRVRLDAHAASAELAAFEARIAALNNNNPAVPGGGADSGGPQLSLPSLKAAAIVGALPLVGPVAGAASGALLQLAGAAGVAGLAVKGMNNEIEQGTPLGNALRVQVDGLSADLTSLEQSAAKGASTGVTAGLQQLHAFMPTLNPEVQDLATHLGNAFATSTGGLLQALRVASPLLNDAGRYAELLAGKLDAAARSPEFARFIGYARQELPVVVHALTELTGSAVHLGEALAPIGSVGIAVLDGLATTLNHIPVGVLTGLAEAATAGYLAFKGYAIISGVNIALTAYAERAALAAGASEALAKANARASVGAGSLLAKYGSTTAYAGATVAILLAAHAVEEYVQRNNSEAKALRNATAAQQAFSDALTASKGAVDSGVTGALALQLAQDGLSKKALAAGISQDQLIAGITSSQGSYIDAAGQMQNYAGSLNDVIDQWERSGKPSHDTIKALQEVGQEYQDSRKATLDYLAAQRHFAEVQPVVYGALAANAASLASVGAQYHLTGAQAGSYAALLGITSDKVENGSVTNAQLSAAVHTVADAYNDASQSGSLYLGQLSAFSASQKTAADRAAIMAATLRAGNGDALAYGGAITSAAGANNALVSAFQDQAAAAAANALAVGSAQAAISSASSQASRSLSDALDGVAGSERAITSAQQAALNAQLALTDARRAAKVAAEDLANQVIDGQLSERQAVLSLKAARDALNKPQQGTVLQVGKGGKLLTPKTPATVDRAAQQLAYDQAAQQLAEVRLQNKRLAAEKAAADRAGINGSAQVIAAQQGVASATQGISDAQRNLAKSQQAVADAQVSGAQAIAAAQRGLTAASDAQAQALRGSELAAINAKTGLIDYSKQGAGPLVQQLQAMQDAAEKAASATYQHELATKGDKVATEDMGKVYDSLTRGALVRQHDQLGLTSGAAKHLADTYFGMPKDVQTTVQAIGTAGIENSLGAIGRQLSVLTKEPWSISMHLADTAATIKSLSKIAALQAYIASGGQVDIGVSGRGEAGGFFHASGAVVDYYANGGIDNLPASLKHFASGSENHVAQIAPAGSYRVWAEPETGGEAYIPLAQSKRVQSELILAETARRFGDTLVKGSGKGDSRSMAGAELRNPGGGGDVTVQQIIHNPLPERASTTGPKAMRRAAYALTR